MGYSHYFEFTKKEKSAIVEKKYQKAIKECNKIIQYYQKEVKKEDCKNWRRLSGYSAFTNKYGGIMFNGTQDAGHEDFSLREHFNQNSGFSFCKTARKPYDEVVIACLIVLKHRLGDNIDVSSDGDREEWEDGLELAKKALGLKRINNPIIDEVCEDEVCEIVDCRDLINKLFQREDEAIEVIGDFLSTHKVEVNNFLKRG